MEFRMPFFMINKSSKKYKKCKPIMVLSMTAWCSWQVLAVVHHVVMLLCFLAALIWSEATKYNLLREQMVLNMTGKDSTFMAEWKYLTRWDHIVQTLFFLMAVAQDVERLFCRRCPPPNEQFLINKNAERPTMLQQITDFTFHCFAIPLSVVVCFMYWSLKVFVPKMLSAVSSNIRVPPTPKLLNHATHTLILVAVVIELFLVYRRRPNWKYWTLCPSIFLYMYLIFATIVRSVKGFAVYGILDSPLYLTILFILIGPLMWLLGYLVTLVHNWYWSERRIRSYQLSPKQLLEESNKIEA